MKDRVIAFGDAVIAIILTIIVLELPITSTVAGGIDFASLFRSVGIYFISFCFVANLWFQTTYTFKRIKRVKNKTLVIYLLLLFFLSLVPAATRLLIEDTSQETILIYGGLTFIVTFVMRRMNSRLTKQATSNKNSSYYRIDELNRQDLFSFIFRFFLLIFSFFYVEAALIMYLVLPILNFMQNIIDREEDSFIATLDKEEQNSYYQDRDRLWGNAVTRYSKLLRDSLRENNGDKNKDHWKEIMDEWIQQIDNELTKLLGQLSTADAAEKHQLNNAINRLKRQKENLILRKSKTEARLNKQNENDEGLKNNQ